MLIAAPGFTSQEKNPFLHLLYGEIAARGVGVVDLDSPAAVDADVVHFHWPDSGFTWRRPGVAALWGGYRTLRLGLRFRTARWLWTVHNLRPHDAGSLIYASRTFERVFVRRLDGWVSLSATTIAAAESEHPELRHRRRFVIPHHNYRRVTGTGSHHADGPVLSFGQLRPYKGIEGLLTAWDSMEWGCADADLIVAGEAEPAYASTLTELAGAGMRLEFGRLNEDALVERVTSARLCILPYTKILNSGSALFALSCATPTLLPDFPVLRELHHRVGGDWVRLYKPGHLAPDVLAGALQWASAERTDPPDLDFCDVEVIADAYLTTYRALAESGPRRE